MINNWIVAGKFSFQRYSSKMVLCLLCLSYPDDYVWGLRSSKSCGSIRGDIV